MGRYLDPQQGEVLADSYVHADQHKLLFHPDYDGVTEQRIYSLNDGIYVTDMPNDELSVNPCDANSTPIQWQSLNAATLLINFITELCRLMALCWLGECRTTELISRHQHRP